MEGRFSSTPRASLVVSPGEVSEWLKEHAWKVCIRQRIEGSNPSLSATHLFAFSISPRGPLPGLIPDHIDRRLPAVSIPLVHS